MTFSRDEIRSCRGPYSPLPRADTSRGGELCTPVAMECFHRIVSCPGEVVGGRHWGPPPYLPLSTAPEERPWNTVRELLGSGLVGPVGGEGETVRRWGTEGGLRPSQHWDVAVPSHRLGC